MTDNEAVFCAMHGIDEVMYDKFKEAFRKGQSPHLMAIAYDVPEYLADAIWYECGAGSSVRLLSALEKANMIWKISSKHPSK